MRSESDARKRLHPEPLPHWSPDVVALIEKARAEGYSKGYGAGRDEGWADAFQQMRDSMADGGAS